MRYRATILSLVAIAFVAVMILPALSVWILAAVSGIGEIWVLLAVGLLLFAIKRPKHNAVSSFLATWREHVRSS